MHIRAHDVVVSTAAIPQMSGIHSSSLRAGSCHVHGDGWSKCISMVVNLWC